MKSLFNKYEAYTKEGKDLDDELLEVLDPIFEEWAKKGYNTRDIEAIALGQIVILGAVLRMKLGVADAKAEQEKRKNVTKE